MMKTKYVECGIDSDKNLHILFLGIDKTFDVERQMVIPVLCRDLMDELYNFLYHFNKNRIFCNEIINKIYIKGFGKDFAAGANIKEFSDMLWFKPEKMARDRAYYFSKLGQETLLLINQCPRLKEEAIAIINGFALGGGWELAMACHKRIASSSTIFGLPETTLGLIPGWGGTQWWKLFKNKIDKEKFTHYMKTGSFFDADEAFEMGLIDGIKKDSLDSKEKRKKREKLIAASRNRHYSRFAEKMIDKILMND